MAWPPQDLVPPSTGTRLPSGMKDFLTRLPWKWIGIAGGVGLVLLLTRSSKAGGISAVNPTITGINPFDYSIPNPGAKLKEYKTQLKAKVFDPAVRGEIESWDKAKVLAVVASVILDKSHAAIVKGILQQESGFFPGALADTVYSYTKVYDSGLESNSSAFGGTQITKTTFNDVKDSTKHWRALPFRHEDLWVVPWSIEATYKVLLHKGLKKNPKAALKSYRGDTDEVSEKYANAVLTTAGLV